MRIFRLGWRLARVTPSRHGLLALLVAAGLAMYAVFAQLETLAGHAIQQAVIGEFGNEGQYGFTVPAHAVSAPLDFARRIEADLAPVTEAKATMVSVYHLVSVGCEPGDPVVVGVLPAAAKPGPGLRWGSGGVQQCIGGVVVPSEQVAMVSGAPYSALGVKVVVRDGLARSVMLASGIPGQQSYVVTTSTTSDQVLEMLREVVREELSPFAALNGLDLDALARVTHLNNTGEDIKSAAQQSRALYAQLRWAVVAFAALVLLAVQLGQVRRRMWLYGLVRAHGGGAPVIVASVAVDSAVAVIAGGLLAALGVMFISPFMANAAINLGQPVSQAAEPLTMVQLVLGVVVLLAVGAIIPTSIALRSDPLDVLEPRTD